MADSNRETQDQRNSSLEDSPAMTIEYLRVRLLSERSVSRTARQRASELEKRVEELEEQLRVVSLQRKMAEKATAEVLSILENRGINDTSEPYDSGSDHETHRESPTGNGEERSFVSKRRIDSGSDLDSSPMASRSLSWKGRTDSLRSREKDKDPSMRRPRTAVSSIGSSSPKHHLGKSCRQIRRRDTRMVVERKTDMAKFDTQENGAASQPNGVSDCSDSTTEIVREGSRSSSANERNITNHVDANGHMLPMDMEKQAQPIDQYEEMEKAQREWEEKYRETNNNTLESYDTGIQSDVTEERDEIKALTPVNVGMDASETEEPKAEPVIESTGPPNPQANGFLPPLQVDNGILLNQTSTSVNTIASRYQAQEFAFPTAKQKEADESLDNHDLRPPQNFNHSSHFNRPFGNQSCECCSSDAGSCSNKGDHSGNQNDLYALVPHNPLNALGNVLEALKQAKLQLNKMNRSPLEVTSSSVHSAIQLLPAATRVSEGAEISVGCAGLFRLPTDIAAEEANTRANFVGSRSSTPPLSSYYPSNEVAVSIPDPFPGSPYIERQSVFPPDDRLLGGRTVVSGSRASFSLNSHFDQYSDSGPPSVNRYNYSPQPAYPPSGQMQRMPSDMGFLRTFPGNGVAFNTPGSRMPFYNDYGRPNNMYR